MPAAGFNRRLPISTGAGDMRFFVEKHSDTSSYMQITEQIKLAVMMGTIRNGETLPSIRDIEKQTGVNRNQAYKAYQALRQLGLITSVQGKGTVVTTATDSTSAINAKCDQLSKTVISQIRQLDISPTAFARYLSQKAKESERNEPFVYYVDSYEENAIKTANQISDLWHIPIAPIALSALKDLKGKEVRRRKYLTAHVLYEYVRVLLPRNKSAIIPIKVHYSKTTMRNLAKMKPNSSAQLILLQHPSSRIRFIIEQIHKLLKSPGIQISAITIHDIPDFNELLTGSPQYDYYIVGAGVRAEVPRELRRHARVVILEPKLDPASLEVARIRAGVVL
jgi:GntR family transcriptional regulator